MGKLLDKMNDALKKGQFPSRSFNKNKWLADNIKKMRSASSRPTPGLLQMFHYDAKTKEKLPYWDRLPLALPIEVYENSFLGINFHYLPLNLRVHLLDALLVLTEDKAITPNARIQASYGILSSAARFAAFRPCIKKYLYSHIQSRILTIEPEGWEAAINLPVATFQKAGNAKVWADSRRKI